MLPTYLNPMTVFKTLGEIDREYPSHSADRESGLRTTLIVLFSVCVSLLMLNYLKNSSAMNVMLEQLARWQGSIQSI